MTLIEEAKNGMLTDEIRRVAEQEDLSPEFIREGIVQGKIVIPKNRNRTLKKLCGIGKGLRTKVNANIGSSSDLADVDVEIKKARVVE